MEDFLILHGLGIKGRPSISPSITSVLWNPPLQGWLKVNINGAPRSSSGHSGCSGIFHTYCCDIVKRCFSVYLGVKIAFETEMMRLILALELAARFN